MSFPMQSYTAPDLLDLLVRDRHASFHTPVMIVVAHPDDETIGIGAQLSRLRNVVLVHVTDGSPANLTDAQRSGFSNSRDYAIARRIELCNSLALAGIPPTKALGLNITDQEAVLHLPEITRALRLLVNRFMPAMIFTHPYEGGHPDHDVTAFCLQAACRGMALPPHLIEMTFYHRNESGMVTGQFLPPQGQNAGSQNGEEKIWQARLNQEEVRKKRKMFHCFTTQQGVLSAFPLDTESFRLAPRYDFSKPPHPGILHYEQLPFHLDAERFCELFRGAIRTPSL